MQVLAPGALAPFFNICTNIANETAESDGFVPVRKLLARFQTTLRVRPLLVEGMIGSISPGSAAAGRASEWIVFVDSERYPVDQNAIETESAAKPLPVRLRFTVAHELAHSLAFRPTEFGIVLEGMPDKPDSRAALVEAIEKETDRLAPLLLCAEQVLTDRLRNLAVPIDVQSLTRLRREFGVSRHVLFSRLSLSRLSDRSALWQRPQLREFGLAMGEWGSNRKPSLRRWPLFANFPRGVVPRVLLMLRDQDRVPFEVAFGQEAAMALQSGREVTLVTDAGTTASPAAERMTIEVSLEDNSPVPGSSFLVLVRNQDVRREIEELELVRKARRL